MTKTYMTAQQHQGQDQKPNQPPKDGESTPQEKQEDKQAV